MRSGRVAAGVIALLLGLGLAGCGAARQYFEPAERVTGQTENGYAQALYPLAGPKGPFGEATLWSRGAYRVDASTAPALRGGASLDDRTVVQIGFSLHNTSDEPIELRGSELRIGTMRTNQSLLSELVPADPSTLTVAPQSIGETQFHFVLPSSIDPRDVRAFRLRWAVHAPYATYRQRTVFLEVHARESYPPPPYAAGYPCWPYGPYDCLYGPPYWGAYPPPYPVGYPRYPSIRTDRTSVRPDKD